MPGGGAPATEQTHADWAGVNNLQQLTIHYTRPGHSTHYPDVTRLEEAKGGSQEGLIYQSGPAVGQHTVHSA